MSEQYTAQEMLEASEFFERNAEMVRRVVKSNSVLANIHEVIPMLRQAADMMELEEERKRRRKKKYEYVVKYISGCGLHCKVSFNTLDEANSFIRNSIASGKRICRREVGEWEEVKDGE